MIPGSANPLLLATAAAGGYTISRSVRLNASDSAYLSRTPASAGNRKTWTWAGWVKRSNSTGNQTLFSGAPDQSYTLVYFIGDTLLFESYGTWSVGSIAVFRDYSAWMHVVAVADTTNATANDRMRLYVNGARVATSASGGPAQNTDLYVNQAGKEHRIGSFGYTGYPNYFSGCLADIHFIDGQALDPTSFGEFSATTGVWMPKAFTGSYGTNGFKLDFADNSAATAAALGKDTSGNGNNWTPTNLSVTAGAGNDSLVDVPVNGSQTDTGVGGEVRGNYCTLNPLVGGGALNNGNLDISASSDTYRPSTIGVSTGKWYAEMLLNSGSSGGLGIYGQSAINGGVNATPSRGYFLNGQKYSNGSLSNYGNSYTSGDVVGIAIDVDAGKVWFSKNGTWQASGDPAAGTNAAFTDIGGQAWFITPQGASYSASLNFGQRPFAYTAPSGFKALCTANLPAPTIVKPSTVMDVVLYAADVSGGKTISMPGGFSPDLVWIKNRDNVERHYLIDKVRGDSTFLNSNTTDSEAGATVQLNGTSLTLGNSSYTITDTTFTQGEIYFQNRTYASWCWDAGSSTVSNTAGTITSSVRANASAGFSVVTASVAGGLNSPTIGHGLGVTPGLIIAKSRNETLGWYTWHSSFSSGDYILLNSTAAKANSSNVYGTINSSIFTIGGTNTSTAWVSGSTGNYVFYCFAPVAGYSAFGSYTGNGSADGPFVFCNFRPRWVMVKYSSGADGNWIIYDALRGSFNLNSKKLAANLSSEENQSTNIGDDSLGIDFLSNGFKIRATGANHNISSGTYVWAAFAESPFQYSRAR